MHHTSASPLHPLTSICIALPSPLLSFFIDISYKIVFNFALITTLLSAILENGGQDGRSRPSTPTLGVLTPLHLHCTLRHTSASLSYPFFSQSTQGFLIPLLDNWALRLTLYSAILEDGGQDGGVSFSTAARGVLHLCISTALPHLHLHHSLFSSLLFQHRDLLYPCSPTFLL